MSPDKTSSIYRSKGVYVKPKAWKLTHKDLRSQSRFATASGNLPVPPKPLEESSFRCREPVAALELRVGVSDWWYFKIEGKADQIAKGW